MGLSLGDIHLIKLKCIQLKYLDISENEFDEFGLFQAIPESVETLIMKETKFNYLEKFAHQNLIRLDMSYVCK